MTREPTLTPAPTLRPLTWAGVEAACAWLAVGGRPATLPALLTCDPSALVVTDPAAFVAAACADGDPGAAILLRWAPGARAVASVDVALAFWAAVAGANAEAARYGARRRAQMPEAYRSGFAQWSAVDPEEAGRPSPRSLAADLASRGPDQWLVLETWPLARTLRFLEDAAVSTFLAEVEEMARPRGARAHG